MKGNKKRIVKMLFLSSFINKIDKKGRVSVPSSFRAILFEQDSACVIAYESIKNKCVECCSSKRLEMISNSIDNLDPYSDEADAFAATILGASISLAFDPEGRIVLPEELVEFAGLNEKACFVGKGKIFEIWNPQHYQEYFEQAKKLANEKRNMLKFSRD
jgi:MraZ protein